MKMRNKIVTIILALVLVCALTVPAAANDTGKVGEYNVISGGDAYTAAIDENGSLWTWGSNDFDQLGNGGGGNAETADPFFDDSYYPIPIQTVPVRVLDNVAGVSCGEWHTAAIRTDGTLWMWGNDNGMLGNGGGGNAKNRYGNSSQTVPVQVLDNVAAVSCGMSHTAAIRTDGTLWTWGSNADGQLGNGGGGNAKISGSIAQTVPVQVMDDVAAVSCGYWYTAAIKTDGTLWTWGANDNGQLGNGSGGFNVGSNVPVQVLDNVAAVSCGYSQTAAIKTDGTLWMWGWNCNGELGNGGGTNAKGLDGPAQTVPVQVLDNVVAVSCGNLRTAALRTDGTLWMWGQNYNGELGNGGGGNAEKNGHIYQTVPVQVLDNVAAVKCGRDHTVAVKTDGTLWTWGNNYFGQYGNGATKDSNVPVQITLGGGLKVKMPTAGATPIAYASTQTVDVDGRAIEFQCYALKDANGNATNYIKLRDLAILLNGSAAQFQVGWDGSVTITTQTAYIPNGSELSTPYSGDRAYQETTATTKVNGQAADLAAFVLNDDAGGGYTYYQLRDLGKALGFNVGWAADKGIFVETDKPYDTNN